MKCPFKEELDRMETAGIISKYDSISGPAPEWLNSFVTVRKPNGSLHICLDPTDLNKHIVQPVCNSFMLDEIIDKLKGSFSLQYLIPQKDSFMFQWMLSPSYSQ